jgi:hypothetical protein
MKSRQMGMIPGTGRGHSQGNVKNPPHDAKMIVGEDSAASAVDELLEQHPQKWNSLGPHHNADGT